jgi:hypothetical protein
MASEALEDEVRFGDVRPLQTIYSQNCSKLFYSIRNKVRKELSTYSSFRLILRVGGVHGET